MHAVIFKDPAKYQGRVVPIVGEEIAQPQIASIISEVTGKTVRRASLPPVDS